MILTLSGIITDLIFITSSAVKYNLEIDSGTSINSILPESKKYWLPFSSNIPKDKNWLGIPSFNSILNQSVKVPW